MDAAVAAALSELDDIFLLAEGQRTTLKAFLSTIDIFRFTSNWLLAKVYLNAATPLLLVPTCSSDSTQFCLSALNVIDRRFFVEWASPSQMSSMDFLPDGYVKINPTARSVCRARPAVLVQTYFQMPSEVALAWQQQWLGHCS